MPRIELTPSQQAHAREVAEKAARIMEPLGDESYVDWLSLDMTRYISPLGFWTRIADGTGRVIPTFLLDGTDPDDDAIATARMKERMIEWGCDCFNVWYVPNVGIDENPWEFWLAEVPASEQDGTTFTAPLEVIAIAEALIAVDEERRKSSSPVEDQTQPGKESES